MHEAYHDPFPAFVKPVVPPCSGTFVLSAREALHVPVYVCGSCPCYMQSLRAMGHLQANPTSPLLATLSGGFRLAPDIKTPPVMRIDLS